MTSRRIALYSFSLLSIFLLNLPARAQAGEPKYKGVDCGTLPTRTETADCTAANFQVKTILPARTPSASAAIPKRLPRSRR